ncbi:MAG: undecaprenyl-phosphate glucose phosphotransferase [Gallionella sp.]
MSNMPTGLLRPYSSKLAFLHRLLDGAIILFSLPACNLLFGFPHTPKYDLASVTAVLLFLFFAEVNGIYRSWRSEPIRHEIFHVLVVWVWVVCSLVILAFLIKVSALYSRRVVLTWLVLVPSLLILMRVCVRAWLHELRKHGWNSRTVAIAGAGRMAGKLIAQIESAPWMGLRVAGIYDDQDHGLLPVNGKLSNLVEDVNAGRIDYVYITLPSGEEMRSVQLIDDLADTTTTVCVVPDHFVFDLLHAQWNSLGGMPVVSVFASPFYEVDGWLKRAEDIVLGSLILLLAAVPMLLIAIGVKLTSPGQVLFKQRRYGLNGEVIEVLKFRTMTVCEDGDHVTQAKKCDQRLTRLGAFLRKTSLDELPQFINVLQGTMSIVGPRPHAVAHNEQYRKMIHGYMLRHKVKPGITGWAQVNGWRGETDTLEKMEKRVEHDLTYMREWSLWLDIKIILRTAVTGFFGKNVY